MRRAPAAPPAEGVEEVTRDAFLRPQVPDWLLQQGCVCAGLLGGGAWAPLLLSSADMPRRAALLLGEVLGPCRHARSSTQAWGQCPWPAVSPEPSGLPEHCLTVVTRMKEQPRGRHQRRTLKTPATRTTRTGRSAGRRVSWCLCIGQWVLETPAHHDQHGGVASTGPTGPRAEGPWAPSTGCQ